MAKKSSKKKTLSVNFKGVEGKRSLPPEDDYRLEVEEVEMKEGDKAPYLSFTFKIVAAADGSKTKAAGGLIWDNASTSEKSLWRLRSLLEALGVDVPDDEMDIDTDDLVGREMVGVIAHEKDPDYGTKAKLADFYAIDGDAEEGEEEEEERPSKKSDKKNKKRDAEEEEEGESDEDEDDKKARRRKERRAARKERGGDDDGGDDEDDKKSSKKDKKSDKKKAKKYTADNIQDMDDEDDLQKVIDKTEIEVDLDDYKTLKKKQAAVIDALEDAGLIEEED